MHAFKLGLFHSPFFGLPLLILATLSACGGGSSSSSTSNGNTGAGSTSITYISWDGSANGTLVLDANGNKYFFDAADGCMFLPSNKEGPQNFCLTADATSSTGYAASGPTNCSNPSTNTDCNTAAFDVVLTNNPTGSGCIAVLGDGGATSVFSNTLAVTSITGGFDIVAFTSPTAYVDYWSTIIPICGGSNPYAGMYTITFQPSSNPPTCGVAANDILTIDSGGLINSNTDQVSGTISSSGTGSFSTARSGCKLTFTITGASKDANGLWILTGPTGSGTVTLTES